MAERTDIPNTEPRWRKGSRGGTAQDAAKAVKPSAQTLRLMTLQEIEAEPATPEAVFARVKARGVQTVLGSIRPRTTELADAGLIINTGLRGLSESGKCRSIVWRRTSPEEQAEILARKAEAVERLARALDGEAKQ